MTTMTEIGKEYGAALFMLACEEHARETYGESLKLIKGIFKEEPDYAELLSSPGISLQERLHVIDVAFSDKVPEHILSFIKLLSEKGRISCLMDAIEEYEALLDASRHVYNARVTSAVALTEDEKRSLVGKLEKMSKGTVLAEYFVDEALLGGLIVEMDGKIMDGSLRHRLVEMKEVMNS